MCISAPDFILLYLDEFFTPPPPNTLFVLDGHRGSKLLKSCSNTSLAIGLSSKRMLCATAAPPALGRGAGGGSGERSAEEKRGWMELVQGGLDVYHQPRC